MGMFKRARIKVADAVKRRGERRGELLRDRAIRAGELSRKPNVRAAERALTRAEKTERRHSTLARVIRGKQ